MNTSIPEWDDRGVPAKAKSKKPSHGMAGCMVMVALSVAVVLATVALGIQTKGGCELVASYLERQTGLDLAIGGASVVWPLGLDLADVQTKPTTTPLGGFKARQVRMDFHLDGTYELVVRGAHLDVVKTAEGWVPAVFRRLAALEDVRDTVSLFAEDFRLAGLDVQDSGITWNGPDGDRLAAVEGLTVGMRPVTVVARPLRLFEVAARSVRRANGSSGRTLLRVWVSAPENPYLEVEYRETWEGDVDSVKDWWSAPPGVGKRGI